MLNRLISALFVLIILLAFRYYLEEGIFPSSVWAGQGREMGNAPAEPAWIQFLLHTGAGVALLYSQYRILRGRFHGRHGSKALIFSALAWICLWYGGEFGISILMFMGEMLYAWYDASAYERFVFISPGKGWEIILILKTCLLPAGVFFLFMTSEQYRRNFRAYPNS